MGFEQPIFLQPNTGDPAISYTAQQLRVMFDVMSFLPGVTNRDDLKVTQRAAGANMSVDVAAGSCVIVGSTITYQGKYLARNIATVNVTIPAPPGTGTRTDLVVARILDSQADGSGSYIARAEVFSGGTVPTGASYIPLASVTVAAGAVSIVTANITDTRLLNTQGDVPLWQRTGGNGTSLPNGATVYSTGTLNETIGIDTNGNPGEMVCRQAGRYIVSATLRISNGGTTAAERQVYLEQVRGGTVQRRVASQATIPAAATLDGIALTATGTVRALAGDVIRAFAFHNAGTTLTLNDKYSELSYTGVWVGP